MSVTCRCHTSTYAACDYPGGCGSPGGCCSTRGACVTCPIVRPDTTPRAPYHPPVCDGDRRLLDRWLGDIARLHDELATPEPAIIDERRHERFGVVYFEGGIRHVFSRGLRPSDPLAALGGSAPINARNGQPAVSGSRERAIPVNVNRLDLTAPARQPNLTRGANGAPHQQHLVPQLKMSPNTHPVTATFDGRKITQNVRDREYVRDSHGQLVLTPTLDDDGHLSAATVLDLWVRDIRAQQFTRHRLPDATVPELVRWLRARHEDICDRYPDIAVFADGLRVLRGALRSAAGETEPRPEPCDGVTCDRCDQRALFRNPDDTYRAECGNCGSLYTDDEYTDLVSIQAGKQRNNRPAEEVAALLRRN
ncbi:hypothetical protein Ade02nite_19510 [Paractinoplanes deccanensis]|uniref:Uncharacterized protein n=1 Tax=Paractinoplanes deccanensis TaxID=113561 RepID=A0ABQ3Y022_9ACTN|nr:hypothetical protein [Actinoplanes deccanensis]GID73310.1 hypothetical protein Ade02nite_19510 [Actinoplanes deccanensis]